MRRLILKAKRVEAGLALLRPRLLHVSLWTNGRADRDDAAEAAAGGEYGARNLKQRNTK